MPPQYVPGDSVVVFAELDSAADALAAWRREDSVLFEQGLGFAILAVVSVLGTWPPAIHHHGG